MVLLLIQMLLILAVHNILQILTILVLLHNLIDFHQLIFADPAIQVCDFFQAGNLAMLMLLHSLHEVGSIYIVACGSAYHVGVACQYVLEDLAQMPVRVDLASEFRYRSMPLDSNGLVIVISQSGETADSLAALRLAKKKGLKTLGIVNVVGSSIAREADNVFYTLAGPEIAVATTKAYSTQLIAGYCLAVQFALVRGCISKGRYQDLISQLQCLPEQIQKILDDKERIQWFAAKQANARDVFFIGRGLDYAISLEGSLKMKEISYIHSEAYAAGELKHGTISLIEDGTLIYSFTVADISLYEAEIRVVHDRCQCGQINQTLMCACVQPSKALTQQFHIQGTVFQIDAVQVSNLQLTTGRRLQLLCEINHTVVIEIQAGHTVIALRMLRLFLDRNGLFSLIPHV